MKALDKIDYALAPCLMCGKRLPSATQETNQPSGGTTFNTQGHYGSTVFDPMDGVSTLEINLCDPCLLDAQRDKKVLKGKHRRPIAQPVTYEYWDGK